MPNIELVASALQSIGGIGLDIRQERCVVVRNQHVSCSKCLAVCAPKAITIVDNTISVDPDRCIGCGVCSAVCPTGAIRADRPDDAKLLEYARSAMGNNGGHAVIACREMLARSKDSYDKRLVVEVSCLGRMDEALLVHLLKMGADRVTLVRSDCAQCQCEPGLKVIERSVETCAYLLEAWGRDAPVHLQDRLPEEIVVAAEESKRSEAVDAFSRRDFLKQIRTSAGGVVSNVVQTALEDETARLKKSRHAYEKVQSDGTLVHFVPERREWLLERLGDIGSLATPAIDTHLWGRVIIDSDLCSSCRMCATFCPTGALHKFDDADSFGVVHCAAHCVQCGTCETICPKHAVSVSSVISPQDLVGRKPVRHEMAPMDAPESGPQAILSGMRRLFDCEHVYER